MSEKFVVVQGATCQCKYGSTLDKIKVLSHKKEYANDKEASKKLIATTLEIGGATLENNSFGYCSKTDYACKPMITEWQDYYEDVTLSNGGYIIQDCSKAVCAIAGNPCIEIVDHGQITEPSTQNYKNADRETHNQLNPMVDMQDLSRKERDCKEVIFGSN